MIRSCCTEHAVDFEPRTGAELFGFYVEHERCTVSTTWDEDDDPEIEEATRLFQRAADERAAVLRVLLSRRRRP